ncbi:MAG TPA: ABC transporter permease [Candidatus Angelobacter sp.]
MRSLRRDVRYGLRLVRRNPLFSAVMVITLALGIGANTAIFSILDALLLRSLPVWQPDRLVEVCAIYRNGSRVPLSFPIFQQLASNQRVFSRLLGWTGGSRRNVEVDGALLLSSVRGVTGNYYGELGASPLLGRLVGPKDAESTSAAPVAVLGYEFWQERFGRDPAVIGKVIRIEGEPFTIVGVSRKWFTGMTPGDAPDITIPLSAGPFAKYTNNRSLLWILATGRLQDGTTAQQARAQLQSFWHETLVQAAPTAVPGQRLQSWLQMGLEVNPETTGVNRDLREHFARPLRVLMGVSILVLLVACVNLASLTLARSAIRSREMSVRMSLGATRLHVARQFLIESVLLSSAAALLAMAFASWTSRLLVAVMGEAASAPVILDLRPDWRVFSYTALVAIGAGVLIALAPAWQTSRQPASAVLQSQERTLATGTGRLGKGLIVTQIALSFILLIGAGLLLRTFENLRSFDPQFHRSGVLQLVLQRRPDAPETADMNSYRKQLLDAVASLPGVSSASFAGLEIPAGDNAKWKDTVSTATADSAGDAGRLAALVNVSPEFFRTLGIPIVAGRNFDWSDDGHHPRVAIVDSNLARRLAPSGDLLGTRVRFGVQPDFQQLQLVGVTRSARLIDMRDPNAFVIYIPSSQQPQYNGSLFVRAQNPAGIAKAVEREIQSLGREYAVSTKTLAETSDRALAEDRATAILSSMFAGLALLLAGIGLFGLMSYTVTRRTREIGIRMALGSQQSAILRLVLGESLLLTITGVVIGAPCALAATRLIAHVLFGVEPRDPLTFAIAAGALLAIGAAGGYWPARRAMKTDPIIALRCD